MKIPHDAPFPLGNTPTQPARFGPSRAMPMNAFDTLVCGNGENGSKKVENKDGYLVFRFFDRDDNMIAQQRSNITESGLPPGRLETIVYRLDVTLQIIDTDDKLIDEFLTRAMVSGRWGDRMLPLVALLGFEPVYMQRKEGYLYALLSLSFPEGRFWGKLQQVFPQITLRGDQSLQNRIFTKMNICEHFEICVTAVGVCAEDY